ncbi:sugar-binding domain-containing protein [uncultured Victivallis sp.]|uniref:sugar-binding domain-containing protein n=1 Tax=uncultured Victivallis sp. TaxID=354118 RepID=UPI0025935440|nr:sugar-binding domain-containing protein [uncultured Victivallis sp.]
MRRTIWVVLLTMFAGIAWAAEISIAGFLPDPGFERKHEPNAQLNAEGVKEIHGWSARPEKGNPWTSVSYVDRGGRTLGERSPAIEPAEGNSYLRMFTFKSCSWLVLASPEFPVKKGNTYGVAFQVSADRSAPMAKMRLSLEVNWKQYCTETYDLIRLEPGWNTVVYRAAYQGPDGMARLVIRCEREENATGGALNFDGFRAPAPGEANGMGTAAGSEVDGFAVALPFGGGSQPVRNVSLGKGPKQFRLGAPAGRYRLLVNVKSSDRSGNEGDSMFGGYNYWMPENVYRFRLDGRELAPEISGRMVKAAGRDEDGNGIYTGWLWFRDPVEVQPDSELSVECSRAGGFVTQIVLLNETEWKAEQLRMSNLFCSPPGKGFGNAWAAAVKRPERFFPVDSLRYFVKGLETFGKRGVFPSSLSGFLSEGTALADRVTAYVGQRHGSAEEGAALADAWNAYRDRLRREFAAQFSDRAGNCIAEAAGMEKGANPNCHAGREAAFWAGIARRYFEAASKELKTPATDSGVYDFAFFTRILTDLDNGSRYLEKARKFMKQPQETVEFPEFFVERDVSLPEHRLGGTERLLLSGVWQFAPGRPDVLPDKWVDVPIPNDSPFAFYNMANISDEEFGRAAGAYWRAASIREAWFRTSFTVPAGWNGERLFLKFDEVMMCADVFVNGRFAGRHCGGLIPFELDVTALAVPGKENHLHVFVASSEKVAMGEPSDVPRYHKLKAHYLYPVTEAHAYPLRISGDVELLARPPVRAEDVYIRTLLAGRKIIVRTTLVNDGNAPAEAVLNAEVRDGETQLLVLPEQRVTLAPGGEKTVEAEAAFEKPKLWGVGGEYGDPHNRYTLVSSVTTAERSAVAHTLFAFREAEIRGRKLFLNGKEFAVQGSSSTVTERVTARNNKHAELFLNRARKEAHINFLRYHRFNLHDWLVAACDDAGILSEGEGPWWNLFAPVDINGEANYDDPVWLENCREYYVKTMRKFRNAPSMLFFSLENETLDAANHRAIARFRKWAQAEAPHMILMNHSHASAMLPEAPVAVLHDYDLGNARLAEYARNAKKPVVIGEFWNPEVSKAIQDARQARGAERLMKMWLERTVRAYQKAGADGVMPYTFTGLGGISTKRDGNSCGPWSDLYMAEPRQVFSVPVEWPAFSGGGGIRAEKVWLDYMTMRHPVNFFDPLRPAYTLSGVADAYRSVFRQVPGTEVRRSPELLVEVRSGSGPLSGVNVWVEGPEFGRRAVKADTEGRAWFFFGRPGTCTVSVEAAGKVLRRKIELSCTPLGGPGWAYLPRLRFDVEQGEAEFLPGKNTTGVVAAAKMRKTQKIALRPDKSAYDGLPAVGPEGFIRRWLVLGPFPNYASRTNLKDDGLDRDFLGGEAQLVPSLELPPVKAEFKRNPEAFWAPGLLSLRWDWLISPKDTVDLTGAFLIDHPGLEGIIQFIFGYAACYVKSETERDAVLTIGSDDGYKIWLNGDMIGKLRTYRGCKPDENRIPVRLKAGWNRLLVKIEQETGGYEFALRFLDPAGKPLVLETSLTPPVPVAAVTRGGFVRDWMLLGPFPNAGERPKCVGLETAFLKDEEGAVPDAGAYKAEFPAYEKAYYEPGIVVNRWKAHRAAADGMVDLGSAFVRADVPGLDVSPLQYVTGYAAAVVEAPEAGEYELAVSTFNGIRICVNGKPVIDDHIHTFNRDPNSPVLSPSFRKELRCRVRLEKGKNRLLVKADVDYGPFDFSLMFR